MRLLGGSLGHRSLAGGSPNAEEAYRNYLNPNEQEQKPESLPQGS